MIAKFLKASANFGGVFYNTDKVDIGKAEFMGAINFDALEGLNEVRPTDYLNYLKAITAANKNVSQPQLHVAISTLGREHDKYQLAEIAKTWMEKMGYGKQPYLLAFHKDTRQNHIHIVSTRINPEGRKINSGFERVRSLRAINEIMGLDEGKTLNKDLEKAKAYRISTLSQFKLLLESMGYKIAGHDLVKYGKKLAATDFDNIKLNGPDQRRATQIKAIFNKYAPQHDLAGFKDYMKTKIGVELILHSKDGKPAYGYTVIDHAQKNAYKGSEIMPLKQLMLLLGSPDAMQQTPSPINQPKRTSDNSTASNFTVNISKDVDDDQIHGPRRRRKKKARTNTR